MNDRNGVRTALRPSGIRGGIVSLSYFRTGGIRARLSFLIGGASCAIALLTIQAGAHEATEMRSGVLVSQATLTPAERGGSSRLKFRITNDGNRPLILTDVEADVARSRSVVMVMPESGPEQVDRVPILRDETLEVDTHHIRVRLKDLRRPLRSGDRVRVRIGFDGFEVNAVADVH